MYKYLITFVFCNLFPLNLSWAIELEPLKQCGTNTRCLIVDAIEVNIDDSTGSLFNHTLQISTLVDKQSTGMVQKAWKELIYNHGCSDVVDVVVGGTLDEDGAPNSAVPANFATHLTSTSKNKARCTIVVDYSGGLVNHHHDVSVEVGRRALSVVLYKLDSIRTRLGLKQPIRVWGYSKGAAIVESVWTIEAKNARRTLVADAIKNISYDACPSNNCYYMGFGYPYNKETESAYDYSVETANLWTMNTRGYITKPDVKNRNWWRLTTFSNYSDIFYGAGTGTLACHNYKSFLRTSGYSGLDNQWNQPESAWSVSSYPFLSTSVWLEDQCGD